MLKFFQDLFKRSYLVTGPHGGISVKIRYPKGFNPETDKCPVAILMHGFMASKGMHPVPAIARALNNAGIAAVSFDFDAHGRSEGKFQEMTIASEIADAQAVLDYVCQMPCFTKRAFVGHSQGGVIAGMLAGRLENDPRCPDCMVLLAPAAVLKDDAIAGQCMNAKYDPVNPPAYVNVMFHKLGREFILAAQKLPIYEESCRYSGKVLLIHGEKDDIVPVSYSERYHNEFPDSQLRIVPDEGHFMRKRFDEYIGDIVSFIKTNL